MCIPASLSALPSSGEKVLLIKSDDGNIIYVGGSGPGNYTKIQEAIDDSSNGDTIFVYSGLVLCNIALGKKRWEI